MLWVQKDEDDLSFDQYVYSHKDTSTVQFGSSRQKILHFYCKAAISTPIYRNIISVFTVNLLIL